MALEDYLKDIVSDLRHPIPTRQVAARILEQWNAGIIPSPAQLRRLRNMIPQKAVCSKLQPDRSCAWLRRNAKAQGLRRPGPGEKVVCLRSESGAAADRYEECEGFRRKKEV